MKRIIAILMCLLLAFSLIACDSGKKGEEDKTSSVGTTSSKEETSSDDKTSSSDTTSKDSATSSKLSAGNQSGGSNKTSSAQSATANTSSKKTYVDAETDFTGQVTIVGRWHCVKSYETATGKTVDTSKEGEYYILESTGKAESYYMDTLMITYDKYTFTPTKVTDKVKEGNLIFYFGTTTIPLGCIVEENRLTVYTKNSGNQNYQTVYERVPFPQ